MSDDADPAVDGTLEKIEALLDAGEPIASERIGDVARAAARWNERFEVRENGGPRGVYVGGSQRCAALLERLIARGLPAPGALLHERVASSAVLDVLLRCAAPTSEDVDAALRGMCLEHGFDPNLELLRKVCAARPSQAALDDALRSAASSIARQRGVILDLEYFEALDVLLAAGARPDHGSGTTVTALHHFVMMMQPTLSPKAEPSAKDRKIAKSAARATELLRRAVGAAATVDALDAEGNTPLHVACFQIIPERVQLLVAAGADPRRANQQGKTPVDLASGRPELYAALGVPPPPPAKKPAPPAPSTPARDPFAVGAHVSHAKFGDGEITASAGSGPTRKLTVRFASGESRTLAASFLTAK